MASGEDMSAWDPGKHPRDRGGRFARSGEHLSSLDKAAGNAALDDFHPVHIADDAEAARYMSDNRPRLTSSQAGALDRYSGDHFLAVNSALRAGDSSDPDVARLDSAMRPLPHDLVVTRFVQPEAFGLKLSSLHGVEGLPGKKITDRAYQSTSIGTPYGSLGGVTMHIAVPKGTPAVIAASGSRNAHEREIILDRGQPLAVSRVSRNARGGYDMYLVALPKGGSA